MGGLLELFFHFVTVQTLKKKLWKSHLLCDQACLTFTDILSLTLYFLSIWFIESGVQ